METSNLPNTARSIIKAAVPSALLPLTLARSEVRAIAERFGFDVAKFPGRVISDVEPGRIVIKLDVLSVFVPDAQAMNLIVTLSPQLLRHGCQALVTATDAKEFSYIFGEAAIAGETNYNTESLLVFFQAESADPLLWVRGTHGDDFRLDTGSILRRLEEWGQLCEFSILGAGFNWVELRFKTLPTNVMEFAEEVCDFCPNTLNQGSLSPSENYETLDEGDFQGMETLVEWMEDPAEGQSPDELATYLKRERRLYLWWD